MKHAFTLPIVMLLSVAMLPALVHAAEPQLAHMVFFTLADNTPENQRKLVAGCKEYLADHDGVVYFSAGVRADNSQREVNDQQFDVSLHVVFRNKAAHDKYQVHPRHLKFIDQCQSLWSKVRVFDSRVSER